MKKNKNKDNTEKKKKHPILFCLLVIASILILGLIVVSPYMVSRQRYVNRAKETLEDVGFDTFKASHTSIVYNNKDEELAFFKSENDMYYIPYENIPEHAKGAFTVLYDRQFFTRDSIGYVDQVRIVMDSKYIQELGNKLSYIERTLARNVFLKDDMEGLRRNDEIFISLELDKKYSREQIFEFYLNNIYFGNGYYGVETAARGYFGKSLSELSFSQIAFLAAVSENPIMNDPFTNIDAVLVRRNYIVTKMQDYSMIDRADYYRGISEEIVLDTDANETFKFAESYILHSATMALMESLGTVVDKDESYELYTREYAKYEQSIFTNGYRIYTTIDSQMQKQLEESVKNGKAAYEGGVNAIAVSIDNNTGCVAAIVGGDEKSVENYYSAAYMKRFKPLNVLRPLTIYTPFIEWHHNPDYVIYQEATPSGTFINQITLREAILDFPGRFEESILNRLTKDYSESFLYRMGYEKSEEGITCMELAAGFATLANDGLYGRTGCIRKITDVSAGELYNNTYAHTIIYAPNDARIMTDILKEYNADAGITAGNAITAGYGSSSKEDKMAWYVGYSRYYTTAVWMGHDTDNKDLNMNPQGIWSSFMENVHKDLDVKDFEKFGDYTDVEGDFIPPELETEKPSLGGTGGFPDDGDKWIK